jgi:hypothetical protein
MPYSTNVADGDDTLASQYNNLRKDIYDTIDGHDHGGTATSGKKVAHGDLVDDAAIQNTYLTHAKITKHVQGTGTSSDPDDPGGSQGVHGLASSCYVMGSPTGQQVIQWGQDTFNSQSPGNWGAKDVTFPTTFSSTPIVFLTFAQARVDGSDGQGGILYVEDSVTATGFTAVTKLEPFRTAKFNWMAIGTVS